MRTFEELFETHCLASWDKQHALAALVSGRPWTVNYQRGLLEFRDDLSFQIEVLGSRSDFDSTWLWAWANTDLKGCPTTASFDLRSFGAEHELTEFTSAMLELGDSSGHDLAMLAAGILCADCYYRCPYDQGAAFVLIRNAPEVRALADFSSHFVVSRFMDFISKFEVHHQRALNHYLGYKGYVCSYSGLELVATGPPGQSLKARFHPDGRLERIETVVSAPVYPPTA